jgi:Ca-activated chloride channel family protein
MDRLEAATGSRAAPGSAVPVRSLFQRVLLLMVWSLLVLALARPQWIGEATTKTIPSRDVLLAIDLSASMEQEDFVGPNSVRVRGIRPNTIHGRH